MHAYKFVYLYICIDVYIYREREKQRNVCGGTLKNYVNLYFR